MTSRNITLLTASWRGGGAERVQITLAEEFVRLGQNVTLLSLENDGVLRESLPDTIAARCLGVRRVACGLLPLARYLRQENPDVVIAAMTHVGTVAFIAGMLARWHGKLIIRLDSSRRFHRQSTPKYKSVILNTIQRFVFPRAYAMVAVSSAIASEYREDFCLTNCRLIHNPVATNLAMRKEPDTALHPFCSGNAPLVVAIGRLNRQKRFDFLLRAFSVLREKYPAKLLILGEGEEREYLEHEVKRLQLEEHVALPGFVNGLFAYLQCASVYALSSESEPFGLTLVEAMAAGTPVVATRTEGPKDIISDSALGELVEYNDVTAFAGALQRAIEQRDVDKERRISRSRDFAPTRIAKQYLELVRGSSEP